MRVLLTGGRGLVGRPLARILSARHETIALGHDELDVTDAAAVADTIASRRPDVVVHLAAWTNVDGCESDPGKAQAVNGDGTRNVAAACSASGARLIYVSTDYVFDGRKSGPWTETDPVNPLSQYGRSKLEGERAVRETLDLWTIVRSQSIYGTGKKSFVDAILERAAAGQPLKVVTDQHVSPTYAEDLAAALAELVRTGSTGVFHVANAGGTSWFDCARAALDMAGFASVPITPTTAAEFARPAPRPANSVFDCTRFERETGMAMRPWRVALQSYLAARGAIKESA